MRDFDIANGADVEGFLGQFKVTSISEITEIADELGGEMPPRTYELLCKIGEERFHQLRTVAALALDMATGPAEAEEIHEVTGLPTETMSDTNYVRETGAELGMSRSNPSTGASKRWENKGGTEVETSDEAAEPSEVATDANQVDLVVEIPESDEASYGDLGVETEGTDDLIPGVYQVAGGNLQIDEDFKVHYDGAAVPSLKLNKLPPLRRALMNLLDRPGVWQSINEISDTNPADDALTRRRLHQNYRRYLTTIDEALPGAIEISGKTRHRRYRIVTEGKV